jgi:hypothetical protein
MRSQQWENKPSLAPLLSLATGLIFLSVIAYGIFAGWIFPSTVEYRVAIEILRDIVQVDGVLIGFAGLVTTLAVTELGKVARGLANPKVILHPAKGGKQQMAMILKGLEVVRKREWFTIVSAGIGLILFVSSILSSLVGMSSLQFFADAGVGILIFPVCTLVAGIIAIFLILVFSVMQAHP